MKEKRALLCLLAAGLIVNLVACSSSSENTADKSQDTSTPAVTQSVESSTPGITPAPEQTTQTAPETTPTPESVSTPAQEDTSAPKEAESLFTETDETLYATTTVNVREGYSASSNKLGSLSKAQSVKRTGIGIGAAAGWSRIEFNGKVAYVSSDYLSATKPQVSTGSNSGSSSGQTSKPSTGGNTSSGGSSSSGGLGDLANQMQQGRDDMGYSGGGHSGLTDEEKDALAGGLQLD